MNVRQELINSVLLEVGPERFCPTSISYGRPSKATRLALYA